MSKLLISISWSASVSIVIFATALSAQVTLYDGSLGSAPSAQGWQLLNDPLFGNSVTQTTGPTFTTLDTTSPITDRGGYFSANPLLPVLAHPDMPTIDRTVGYDIRFDIRVNVENHTPPPGGDDNGDGLADRAGFSVIAISEDLKGIELGFWSDRIWAQDDDQIVASNLFTQAEHGLFDTTAMLLQYNLRVFGAAYQLIPGGGVAPVLGGRLRDYTSFMGSVDPYEMPSFLFFGDDTTRGEAAFDIARVEVLDLPAPSVAADALVAEIVAGTNGSFYDLTGDGMVTRDDLTEWLQVAGEFYLGAGRAFLTGDANLDGVVDGQDFIVWNNNKFSATAAWTQGDFNADGISDGQDFILWNNNKFQTGINFSAVPEPATTAISLLCCFAYSLVGCRRSHRFP